MCCGLRPLTSWHLDLQSGTCGAAAPQPPRTQTPHRREAPSTKPRLAAGRECDRCQTSQHPASRFATIVRDSRKQVFGLGVKSCGVKSLIKFLILIFYSRRRTGATIGLKIARRFLTCWTVERPGVERSGWSDVERSEWTSSVKKF